MESRAVERLVWLGLGAVVVVVIGVGLWSMRGRSVPVPPILSSVPPFTLLERSGRRITREDLGGEPWIADFIFTRCTGMCPALSTRMAELRRELRSANLHARLVSFSVDPTHDTPPVLQEYAAHFNADDGWWFVTGDRDAVYDLISRGFRLSVAERTPHPGDEDELITHSDRFVLVDGEGRIRGYYHGIDADAVPSIVRDLAAIETSP
jgi:protein SCO1/2